MAWARRHLGIEYDRWQVLALNRALAVDADDHLVHSRYLVSTGRQNGKTAIVRGIIGWALTARTGPDWRRILGLAHDRGQARYIYEPVLEDLEPMRGRRLRLTRYLGIRSDLYGRHREYHVGSKESRNAVRGSVNDLVPFDEMRTQVNYDLWNAVAPTTTTRRDALILGLSTAGDDRSVLLRDWWERGRRIIDGAEPFVGFGMTWYAAGDDDQPDDRRAWVRANPSLAEARTAATLERAIREDLHGLSPGGFRMERLNLWVEGTEELLPPGLWQRRTAPQPDHLQRIVLAVEATPTWRRVSVVVAIVTDAGVWCGVAGELDVARHGGSAIAPRDAVRLVGRLQRDWRARDVAWSKDAAVAAHLRAWAERTKGVRPLELTPQHRRNASELWRSELIGGRLTHEQDPLMDQQVRIARPSGPVEAGNWVLSIPDSPGEIDTVRAMAWAAWAAISPEAREIRPQVFVPGPR